jgi:hypothetical protein
VKASDVKAGACFRTADNSVREVEHIEEGKVRYRSRANETPTGWTSTGSVQYQQLSHFLFDAIEQVPSDWEPGAS